MTKEKLKIYRSGNTAYSDMIQEIRKAEEEINLEYYIFANDMVGREFVSELLKACERGVKVRIVIDGFGSSSFPYPVKKKLREFGAEVKYYNPIKVYKGVWRWILRDHRKLLTVDRKTGFLGGMNISKRHLKSEEVTGISETLSIKDTHVRIKGPTVKEIRKKFGRTWKMINGDNRFENDTEIEKTSTKILGGKLRSYNNSIKEYIRQFKEADQSIKLTQAYFIPPPYIRKVLYNAVDRGVNVQLITPGLYDIKSVRSSSKHLYREMMDNGIKIYEYQNSFLHSKTGVVDGEWASVGSMNIDYQSVLRNLELNMATKKKQTVRRLEKEFKTDLSGSTRIKKEDLRKRTKLEEFRNWFFHRFRWIY